MKLYVLGLLVVGSIVWRQASERPQERRIVATVLPAMGRPQTSWLVDDKTFLLSGKDVNVTSCSRDPQRHTMSVRPMAGDSESYSTEVELVLTESSVAQQPSVTAVVRRTSDIGPREEVFTPLDGRVYLLARQPESWSSGQPLAIKFSLHWEHDSEPDCVHGEFLVPAG